MILKNKTASFQKIGDKMVRPFRTIIVKEGMKFNQDIFEIEKKNKINNNKKNKKGE